MMRSSICIAMCIMAGVMAIDGLQLPPGVADLPNVTDPSYDVCTRSGTSFTDPKCGYDRPVCTGIAYNGNGPAPRSCREGRIGSFYPRSATYDDLNFCNCPIGYYISRLVDVADRPAGRCVPLSRLGQPCSATNPCIEAKGHYLDQSPTTPLSPDGQLFCILGICQACNPMGWTSSTQLDGVGVGEPYTCPGIDGEQSELLGHVVLLSSRPGETRTCLNNGTLLGGGQIDRTLVSVPFPQDAMTTTTTGGNGNKTASSAVGVSMGAPSLLMSVMMLAMSCLVAAHLISM